MNHEKNLLATDKVRDVTGLPNYQLVYFFSEKGGIIEMSHVWVITDVGKVSKTKLVWYLLVLYKPEQISAPLNKFISRQGPLQ